jgi:acetyl-CoA acetyltransferase
MPEALALAACRAAISDAGLTAGDIDGIFEYRFGADSPSCHTMQRLLGVADLAAYADVEITGPSGFGAVMPALAAVRSGACQTALIFRCMTQDVAHMGHVVEGPLEASGPAQFLLPYGVIPTFNIQNIAMKMQRRMFEYGGSELDYSTIVVNARRWSQHNPRAVLRELMETDDYLASPYLAKPLRLHDCDYPVNGACAVVVTTRERSRDLRHVPVWIEAEAVGTNGDDDWMFADDFVYAATRACAKRLWSRSGFVAGDVDVAGIYDGFTHVAISWIEALGFCGLGEFGDWVNGGATIGPGGSLPVNTSGGHLAEGRLHGINLLAEAVLQLRGSCGARQVPDPHVALVCSGFGPQCAAVVLTNR